MCRQPPENLQITVRQLPRIEKTFLGAQREYKRLRRKRRSAQGRGVRGGRSARPPDVCWFPRSVVLCDARRKPDGCPNIGHGLCHRGQSTRDDNARMGLPRAGAQAVLRWFRQYEIFSGARPNASASYRFEWMRRRGYDAGRILAHSAGAKADAVFCDTPSGTCRVAISTAARMAQVAVT